VVVLAMAWSPVRRFNAGCFEVDLLGDYATLISNQLRDGTRLLVPSGTRKKSSETLVSGPESCL
jgi:hypothetical protein